MQCHTVEKRLNELLDSQRPLQIDADLAAHVSCCQNCAQLLSSYETLWEAVQAAITVGELEMPDLEPDFARRVARRVHRPSRIPAHMLPRTRTVMVALGVAVALLIAVLPLMDGHPDADRSSSGPGRSVATNWPADLTARSVDRAPTSAARLELPMGVPTSLDVDTGIDGFEQMWLLTGRNLATLPTTVRRVASWPEQGALSSSIRPVAISVGATVDALLRILPAGDRPPEMPNGDTGRTRPMRPPDVA